MLSIESRMKNAKREASSSWRDLLLELWALSLLIGSIALLWRNNYYVLAVTLLEALATLGIWHDEGDVSFFLIAASLGTIAEILFVSFGVWSYSNPTFFGIPVWFPFAFGTATLIVQRLVWTAIMITRSMKS